MTPIIAVRVNLCQVCGGDNRCHGPSNVCLKNCADDDDCDTPCPVCTILSSCLFVLSGRRRHHCLCLLVTSKFTALDWTRPAVATTSTKHLNAQICTSIYPCMMCVFYPPTCARGGQRRVELIFVDSAVQHVGPLIACLSMFRGVRCHGPDNICNAECADDNGATFCLGDRCCTIIFLSLFVKTRTNRLLCDLLCGLFFCLCA